MQPTFELRYREDQPVRDPAPASMLKRTCGPAELVDEARKIFLVSHTPVIEAWLNDRYMFAIDRTSIVEH